ncbi:MAG: hypothetical protein JSS68_16120 [Actinobacteria bacterium]|nr:hypothetical protein [Actinomycetota bacterium]
MRRRHLASGALALLACAAIGAGAATADGGHLPGFSLLSRKVAIDKLPESVRFMFGGIPGAKGTGMPHAGHGPVWFGEVERPHATVYAAGNRRWVCESEVRSGERDGGGSCTQPGAAREYGIFDVGACSKGPPRHFRIVGLVRDGISAITVERAGGRIGRTVPVIENTIAFTIGRENVVLHGTGDPSAEGFERSLPLARAAKEFGGHGQAGCSSYMFFEARGPSAAAGEVGGS